MAERWSYSYIDFGEARGHLPQPILRAVIEIGSPFEFGGLIDAGGPVTTVSAALLTCRDGDPIELWETIQVRPR